MTIRRITSAAAMVMLGLATAAFAQEVNVVPTNRPFVVVPGSYFYLAIVVGVILAISFELILTHLSVAAGISAVGPFDKRKVYRPKKEWTPSRPAEEKGPPEEEESTTMAAVTKATNLVGIWTLVTATISLFFASWLAVRLSTTLDVFHGLVLGLAIWALFYIFMTVIQVTALTSLVGSLIQTAIGGLRSAYKATTAVFGKSEEDRIVDTAEKVTAAVRDELFGDVDVKDLRQDLEKYVQQFRPASPKEFKEVLHDLQMLFQDPKAGADLMIRRLKAMDRDTLKSIVASRKDMSEEDAEQFVSQLERTRDEALNKYEQMKMEVQQRIEDARDRALREAEEARQAAQTAAWWTFGSAVLSAAAAVVGGILSTYT
jgi:hypothetical protein